MTENDDAALLDAIQQKDGKAFACLVKRHAPRYYGLAYRVLRNRESAEDVVQDAFLRLWSNPFLWDKNRNAQFTSWFYRVVVNLCLDQRRRRVDRPLDEVPDIIDRAMGAEESMMAHQQEKQVLAAIHTLPTRQQMAVQLYYYDGLPQAEAAAAMVLTLKAYQSLLQRARQTLVEWMTCRDGETSEPIEGEIHERVKRLR